MPKETARERFNANTQEALALLELIKAGLEDSIERCAPDGAGANWGHVGDVSHVRERLMDLAVGFRVQPHGSEAAVAAEIQKEIRRA